MKVMESQFFREMPRWPIDTWKDTIASDKKTKTYVIPCFPYYTY